MSYPKKHP
jgi:hypothetical protein